ncbi:glutamate mutase [Intrasporangium oryzae NRRL B-24470]|uniref:Glutamate mutase n=1 Tax=Intrasporangium oryzae NRRL B-24470 TaxID=1386089 RepID=W9G1F1_9MICO|nr:glutamate mutase L [Intrasporangium oryzae]EWS99920.1 glutamate mutase [Intrasporangium oryzae NRRL B-24470]
MTILTVDFGSTFTKGALLADDGAVIATAATPTTGTTVGSSSPTGGGRARGDILEGYRTLRDLLDVPGDAAVHACSSAGGGLRLAVVGYERTVTAQAGQRVGLSAGAKVVHVTAGELSTTQVSGIRAARPDIVLLVGGTDGGNADVLLHNASRLAAAALGGHGAHAVPVVVAGNIGARDEAAARLATTGRPTILAENVLPAIGVIAPESARSAIRQAFLRHVIGGKGLSRDPAFGAMVEAATPDVVLRGVEVLAGIAGSDVMVVDIGGATTDVYSCLTPEGEDATLAKDVVAPLWHARTVEGDLGMRWNALGVVDAATAEHLLDSHRDAGTLEAYAARVHEQPGSLPRDDAERRLDLELARLAAVIAVRRHARPAQPTESPRPLANVTALVGSGGVLRHADPAGRDQVLGAVLTDHAGGWKVPRAARATVDTAYLLFAAGLLAEREPDVARAVAAQVL